MALFGALGPASVVQVYEVAEVVVIGNGTRAARAHRLGVGSSEVSPTCESQPSTV
ncbi:hypothetical protein [Nocardiopsis listeri]|uniref:hypothetical protein n=1 Tax=Nocardiopsis listeri TaxID=53440 RepID=UPI001CC213D4|nr:hypothetical protein [Nocardiopsis listeri]